MKSSITLLERRSFIWPCATAMRASGTSSRKIARDAIDGLDAVVDEEDLPAALELADARVADEAFVVARDVRADRQPVDRRRLDDAQVADARERHRGACAGSASPSA